MASCSIYSPLGSRKREIRVLSISKEPSDDNLVDCSLKIVSLDNKPNFTALSYCWGAPEPEGSICVNGVPWSVTPNLAAALRHLRSSKDADETPIWIDALCINQSDVEERNAQVAMMMSIYAQAGCVHLWLGDETGPSAAAMVALEEVVAGKAPKLWFEKSLECVATKLGCLCEIGRNPYWQRTWILQEVSFARNMIIHARESRVDMRPPLETGPNRGYNAMMELYNKLQGVSNSTRARFAGCMDPDSPLFPSRHILEEAVSIGNLLDVFVRVNWSRSMQLVNQTERLEGDLGAGAFDFPQTDLFIIFRTMLSTDPKDKIYGLLGFVTSFRGIQPDYKKTTKEIYCSATVRLMRDAGDLTYFNQACSNEPELPSWVPDYSRPCQWNRMAVIDRLAQAASTASTTFDTDKDNRLLVRGFMFDRVTEIGQGNNLNLEDVDALHGTWYAWLSFHSKLFEKTVDQNGRPTTRLCDLLLYVLDIKEHQIRSRCVDWLEGLSEPSGRIPHEFMSTIAQMIDQYEVFSTARGYCGIAPRQKISVGNNLAIIAGARVPFCITVHPPSHSRRVICLKAPCVLEGNSGPSRSVMYGAVAVAEAVRRFNDPGRINEIFEEMTIV